MGKVKKIRQRCNAIKGKDAQKPGKQKLKMDISKLASAVGKNTKEGADISENIFAALKGNFGASKGKSPKNTSGAKNTKAKKGPIKKTSTFIETKHVGKIKRRRPKERHHELMKKINTIRAAKQAEVDRKKREQTKVVGDLQPMLSALPTLEEVLAKTKKQEEVGTARPRTKKRNAANKEFLENFKMMMAVNKDKTFKDDPFGCVKLAVQNRILFEEEDSKK